MAHKNWNNKFFDHSPNSWHMILMNLDDEVLMYAIAETGAGDWKVKDARVRPAVLLADNLTKTEAEAWFYQIDDGDLPLPPMSAHWRLVGTIGKSSLKIWEGKDPDGIYVYNVGNQPGTGYYRLSEVLRQKGK